MARLKRFEPQAEASNGLMLSGNKIDGFSRVNYLNGANLVTIPNTEKGYFLGQPPAWDVLNKKWWGSKKVPMWKKGLLIGVAAVVADQALNKGKFTSPLIGRKARK